MRDQQFWERADQAIRFLYVHSFVTDTERKKIRQRIHKEHLKAEDENV